MRQSGFGLLGRLSMRLASLSTPPYKDRIPLSYLKETGFIEHTAIISHPDFTFGKHCFIGERVIIHERRKGGHVRLGNYVELIQDTILETGVGGSVTIGNHASIHTGCHIMSYVAPITIGEGVMIANSCNLFSYNHGVSKNEPIRKQPLESTGPIDIKDEAWLGTNVTVLQNVTIGYGAVVGAGSLVTKDIPDNAVAAGVPAQILKFR